MPVTENYGTQLAAAGVGPARPQHPVRHSGQVLSAHAMPTISSALANDRSCSRTYATVADAVPEV